MNLLARNVNPIKLLLGRVPERRFAQRTRLGGDGLPNGGHTGYLLARWLVCLVIGLLMNDAMCRRMYQKLLFMSLALLLIVSLQLAECI